MSTNESDTADVARAWIVAASDLQIEVVAPWSFADSEGRSIFCVAYVRRFGGPRGIVIALLDDDEQNGAHIAQQGYAYSALNPESYGEYDRALFAETLSDWGWFGNTQDAPSWYEPAWE